MSRVVVVGDPMYFSIKVGPNPHTRNRWGFRKRVDLAKAKKQWKRFVDQLKDLGVQVLVLPAVKSCPGMVFPANAGVVIDREAEQPFSDKIFLMSRLISGRSGEEVYYQEFFKRLGFEIRYPNDPFEGEADFFPVGDQYILTHGRVIRQHFEPCWGFPPYRRVYGFRTDKRIHEFLSKLLPGKKIISCELMDERFYHGDTVLCPFGPKYEFLIAYLPALTNEARDIVRANFKDRLIPLETEDAFQYAANSFYVETYQGKFLLMPVGVSRGLLTQTKEHGVEPVEVDVSEFFEKGGGSIKCMLLDLGFRVGDIKKD